MDILIELNHAVRMIYEESIAYWEISEWREIKGQEWIDWCEPVEASQPGNHLEIIFNDYWSCTAWEVEVGDWDTQNRWWWWDIFSFRLLSCKKVWESHAVHCHISSDIDDIFRNPFSWWASSAPHWRSFYQCNGNIGNALWADHMLPGSRREL